MTLDSLSEHLHTNGCKCCDAARQILRMARLATEKLEKAQDTINDLDKQLYQARAEWSEEKKRAREAEEELVTARGDATILRQQRNYAEDKLKVLGHTPPSHYGISPDDPVSWTPEWEESKR